MYVCMYSILLMYGDGLEILLHYVSGALRGAVPSVHHHPPFLSFLTILASSFLIPIQLHPKHAHKYICCDM